MPRNVIICFPIQFHTQFVYLFDLVLKPHLFKEVSTSSSSSSSSKTQHQQIYKQQTRYNRLNGIN